LIHSGSSAPSSVPGSLDGDYYLCTSNDILYGPKGTPTSGSWVGVNTALLAGSPATVSVGTTTTGAAGSSASVTNSGGTSAATFNFSIPRGDTGATGGLGSVVTTLPASPVSNEEVYYRASTTGRTIWHLKYNSTDSKWEFIGGPPLHAFTTSATTTTTSGSYDFSGFLSLTLPFAGNYLVTFGASGAYLAGSAATSYVYAMALQASGGTVSGSGTYATTYVTNYGNVFYQAYVSVTGADKTVALGFQRVTGPTTLTIANQRISAIPVGSLS
jgi:hypothetical protein